MGGTGREGERRGRGGNEKGVGKVRPAPNANSWIRPWSVMHFVDIVSNQSNRLRCNKLLSEIL